jgi:RNA polymerase sigma-70 factor (ECF subfamily)
MDGASERELSDLAARGNTDALAALFERFGPAVRAALAAEIPSRYQALVSVDDIMQETYTDAFLGFSQFTPRGPGSFAAWLTTVARRNLLDVLRMLEADKRGGRRRIHDQSAEESLLALHDHLASTRSTPSRHASRKEAVAFLRCAIGQLPPKYRTVVEMYDLEGKPVTEVAAALGRSPGAVFMLRSRAHRMLAANLGTASRFLSDSG